MKRFRNLFFVLLSFSLVLSGCSTSNENASQTTEIFTYGDEEKAYVAQVEENSAYGLDITQRLLENKSNEHGYRTAGSQAEFEAGEMLVKEFESIGLQNVHKDAFTTDGLLKKFDLVVLEDDKNFFPPYNAIPLVREETLEQYPEIEPILNKLGTYLTDEVMQDLNYQVDELGNRPEKVATDFLDVIDLTTEK